MKTPRPKHSKTAFLLGFMFAFSLCSGSVLYALFTGKLASTNQIVMHESEVDQFYSKLMETR
jgi:hypothetical protein